MQFLYGTKPLVLLPDKPLEFNLKFGTLPSFSTIYVQSEDGSDIPQSGDVTLIEGTAEEPTCQFFMKDMYKVSQTKLASNLWQVVLADIRVTWRFLCGTRDFNTYQSDLTLSRELGTDPNVHNDYALTNLNSGADWSYSEIIEQIDPNIDTAGLPAGLTRPPRHVVGTNIPIATILATLLNEIHAILVIQFECNQPTQLKAVARGTTESTQLTPEIKKYAIRDDIGSSSAYGKLMFPSVVAISVATPVLNGEDKVRVAEYTTVYGMADGTGKLIIPTKYAEFAPDGTVQNGDQLQAYADEIAQEYVASTARERTSLVLAGLHPLKLDASIHELNWIISSREVVTKVRQYHAIDPNGIKPSSIDTIFEQYGYPVASGGVPPRLWGALTGHTTIATNRWSYTFSEAIPEPGGTFRIVPEGLTDTAYNTMEAGNAATGTAGSGDSVSGLPTGVGLLPIGVGAVVQIHQEIDCDGNPIFLFQAPNNLGWECPT